MSTLIPALQLVVAIGLLNVWRLMGLKVGVVLAVTIALGSPR